mmetsp:Transcript_6814/g.12192  ORF Transcript_6814/g.12192 Transcript_6814/m.12192 type:complete len:238 (-) Transcript_6814:2362-3075(-)
MTERDSDENVNVPCSTLYVKNLNEKLHTKKVRELLYYAFGTYGRVVNVYVSKGNKLRGQAFVAMEDVASATSAMRNLQGILFGSKPLSIHYAVSESYVMQPDPKKRKAVNKKRIERNVEVVENFENKKSDSGNDEADTDTRNGTEAGVDSKREDMQHAEEIESSVLFVAHVPESMELSAFDDLFQQFDGYQKTRLVREKQVAFVDFESAQLADIARTTMNDFEVMDGYKLDVQFAKQ